MGFTPKVSVGFTNNNLLQQVAIIDGYAAFLGDAHTAGNYGKVYTIASLADAVTQGITSILEPEAYRQLNEFYTELVGKQQCYLMLHDPASTMTAMLDSSSPTKANLLVLAGAGKIAYLSLFKTAAAVGTDYLDDDVATALAAAKTFVQYWNGLGYFFRVIVPGIISTEANANVLTPNTTTNDYAGVLLGSTLNDGKASVGMLLGRKVKYPCHIKQGKVANGPLSAATLYIGTKKVETLTNLDTLAGQGFMVPVVYPNKGGYYYGVDYMANNSDFNILVYGAVADACARVALAYYTDQLEGEVTVDSNGQMLSGDAQHLIDNIVAQVKFSLGDRISDFKAIIDLSQVIVPGNTFNMQLQVIPKGYYTFINITIGLTA